MRLLVSGNSKQVAALAQRFPSHLGHLLTPKNGNSVQAVLATGLSWGADNGAYSGFEAERFRRFLGRLANQPRCLFVAVPDVVADARATLERFHEWRGEIAATGQPVAFVGQDGIEDLDVPWNDFAAWFIGGSDNWKLTRASADMATEAKRRGKWVHMGRVNSMLRLRKAYFFGCDSCDGSSYSRFHHRTLTHRPDMSLARHLRFLRALEANERIQRPLFEEYVLDEPPNES